MAELPGNESLHWDRLSPYSACDVSDALLKVQKHGLVEVASAGHLVDIVPYAPASPYTGSIAEQPKVIGPAWTLKMVPKDLRIPPTPTSSPNGIPPGQHWVDLTDHGHIVVIEQPQEQSCAAIGGIMALRMKAGGVKGCVVGGRVRDLKELKSSGLPVWARGKSTVGMGAEARVLARNVTIALGKVMISPGDIIFCDPVEGVVAIPRALLEDVIALLPKLVAADDKVKADVLEGSSVAAAFRMHRG